MMFLIGMTLVTFAMLVVAFNRDPTPLVRWLTVGVFFVGVIVCGGGFGWLLWQWM